MGIKRERAETAIREGLSGLDMGRCLSKLARLTDGQLAAMRVEDSDADHTIAAYLQDALKECTVPGGDAAAGVACAASRSLPLLASPVLAPHIPHVAQQAAEMGKEEVLQLLGTEDSMEAGSAISFVLNVPDDDARFQQRFPGHKAALGFWLREKEVSEGGAGANAVTTVAEAMHKAIEEAAEAAVRKEVKKRAWASGRTHVTTSYVELFNMNAGKRKLLQEAIPSPAQLPPVPPGFFKRAHAKKELRHSVMAMLQAMGGNMQRKHNERHTVSYYGVEFVDTHTLRFLNGAAPSVTIICADHGIDARTALAVLELAVPVDSKHRGKMEHYLQSLLDANPDRPFAKGAVFDGLQLVLYCAQRSQEGTVLYNRTFTMTDVDTDAGADNQLGWCSLWTFLLSAGIQGTTVTDTSTRLQAQYGWAVPRLLRGDLVGLPTPHELKLTGMIAASRSVYVWDMLLEGNQPAVCKQYKQGIRESRIGSFSRELVALQTILRADDGDGKSVWPQLQSYTIFQTALVTVPKVMPLGAMTADLVQQMFAGLRFLHTTAKLVNRDLEDKHFGMHDGRLCLFDLSTCVPLDSTVFRDGYAGTLVNASEDVLCALSQHDGVPPRPQQDLVAAVKAVYGLTHTARLPHIHRLASEAARDLSRQDLESAVHRVRQFWAEEFNVASPAGSKWASLVQVAHVDTPDLAGVTPQDTLSYDQAVARLQSELAMLVCPR